MTYITFRSFRMHLNNLFHSYIIVYKKKKLSLLERDSFTIIVNNYKIIVAI